MSLRILHVLDHSIPLQSGYTFRTREILREQRRLGWETHQLTSPKQGPCEAVEQTVDGLLFHRTPQPDSPLSTLPLVREWLVMRRTAARLREVARRVQPHLLHAHSPVLNALPALRVGHELGVPVVYEVRAFWEDAAVDHGTTREGALRYRATRALETYALRRADRVTTICDGLRRDIVARGIAESRVTVIPNAVDLGEFACDRAPDLELKRTLGLADAKVAGFIGSFYAYEGLDILLAALPALLPKVPNARLLLVGGGPEEGRLRALARSLGIQQHVVFAGRVPHDAVQRYYSVVDVLAYPRHSMRLTELVTPLKPLEAMAQGRLLIASDVGGHRELIADGTTGVLFRAGSAPALSDALARLLSGGDGADMRRAARQFVERERSWAASVSRYAQVYGPLVDMPALAGA
jgi:PEP-CTERM/exosortase A-associated glycosyltransferase